MYCYRVQSLMQGIQFKMIAIKTLAEEALSVFRDGKLQQQGKCLTRAWFQYELLRGFGGMDG